jgi:hypothetical protein
MWVPVPAPRRAADLVVIKVSMRCHDDCELTAMCPGGTQRRRMGETEIKIEENKLRDMLKTGR